MQNIIYITTIKYVLQLHFDVADNFFCVHVNLHVWTGCFCCTPETRDVMYNERREGIGRQALGLVRSVGLVGQNDS
jgi:hypothetical protein